MTSARSATAVYARLIAIFAGFVLLGAIYLYGLFGSAHWAEWIAAALERLRAQGWEGQILFVLLEALVALIGFLPASLLGIAAGATYGLWLGFGLSAMGMMVGATAAFAVARSALRPAVVKLFGDRMVLNRFDASVARDGWRLVLMIRISPVMPFSITSYALGLSGVSLRDYVIGTLASSPALLLYVALGTWGAPSLLAAKNNSTYLASIVIGVIAAVAVILRLGRLFVAASKTDAPTKGV
jgi:uncharacterized membrane protein YdjX (TVP38/TMEM64 family)